MPPLALNTRIALVRKSTLKTAGSTLQEYSLTFAGLTSTVLGSWTAFYVSKQYFKHDGRERELDRIAKLESGCPYCRLDS